VYKRQVNIACVHLGYLKRTIDDNLLTRVMRTTIVLTISFAQWVSRNPGSDYSALVKVNSCIAETGIESQYVTQLWKKKNEHARE